MSDPSKIETNQNLDPVAHDRQTGSKNPPPKLDRRRSGYALPPSAQPRRILILIDALSHLDCRRAEGRVLSRSKPS